MLVLQKELRIVVTRVICFAMTLLCMGRCCDQVSVSEFKLAGEDRARYDQILSSTKLDLPYEDFLVSFRKWQKSLGNDRAAWSVGDDELRIELAMNCHRFMAFVIDKLRKDLHVSVLLNEASRSNTSEVFRKVKTEFLWLNVLSTPFHSVSRNESHIHWLKWASEQSFEN